MQRGSEFGGPPSPDAEILGGPLRILADFPKKRRFRPLFPNFWGAPSGPPKSGGGAAPPAPPPVSPMVGGAA